MSGSPFCEHKKLRTSCPHCKTAALPVDPSMKIVPFVPEEERERAAEKRQRRAGGAERDAPARAGPPSVDAEPKAFRPAGPGKPLLPQRKRTNRNISAAEADAVKPWWVKK